MKLQLDYTICIDSIGHAEQSEGEAEQQQSEANAMHAVLASEKAKHATLCRGRAARERRKHCFSQLKV